MNKIYSEIFVAGFIAVIVFIVMGLKYLIYYYQNIREYKEDF